VCYDFEVEERIGSKGEIITPLDAAVLATIADKLKRLGVEAVRLLREFLCKSPA